jgi:S1-C subfamily serine protease
VLPRALLLLVPGDIDTVDSQDFPGEAQVQAVTATVRVGNLSRDVEGSGVLLKRNGPLVYVLTANHVVDGSRRLEVTTFSTDT